MSFFTTGDGYSLRHLADGYPWETIVPADSKGTVVDLGGSHGDAAFAIARAHPNLSLIVQELPQVVANSRPEAGLDVQFMAHDFFTEQPVHGADAYLFRWTLHNWPDKYCIRALRALIPALKKGARVLVMDFVMPPVGVLPNELERKLRSLSCLCCGGVHTNVLDRAMDLTMLEIGNARERDAEGWTGLFAQADARFVCKGIVQPEGSRLAILDVAWEG
jgi:O-methyltransferase domain